MTADLREHPRYAVAVSCELSHEGKVLRGQTKDLSRGGISLLLDQPVPISTVADLSAALIFGDNTFSEPLHVKAVVVWCTKLGPRWQIGAKFSKVTRETRTYLDLFLRFLEGEDVDDEDDRSRDDGKRR
jgi:hypothetical protein